MRLPTVSQMVDENTIAYFTFDGNATNYASGGGVWYNGADLSKPSEEFLYMYDSSIDRKVMYYVRYALNSIGSQIISNRNSTIDFIFKPDLAGAGDQELITFNNESFLYFDTNNNRRLISFRSQDSIAYRYSSDIFGSWHHMAVTIENNSLVKIYLDGKLILSSSYDISRYTHIGMYIKANWNNTQKYISIIDYRISKGIRWTEEFIGLTPLDDVFYNMKKSNDNMYGVKTK